jgi:NAD-dependent SIR2 family protein deacetylase
MDLKNIDHKIEIIDITKWDISENIDIIFHGYVFKLPRDIAKKWIDFFKKTITFKKRYAIIFRISLLNKFAIYIAFFDNIDKFKIFITTNINNMTQLLPLTTELWNISNEFDNVRYSNSFDIGKTIVLETNLSAINIHGSKRYFRCVSCIQSQEWFDHFNNSIHNNNNNITLNEDNII